MKLRLCAAVMSPLAFHVWTSGHSEGPALELEVPMMLLCLVQCSDERRLSGISLAALSVASKLGPMKKKEAKQGFCHSIVTVESR